MNLEGTTSFERSFVSFGFFSGLLALKFFFMSFLTVFHRLTKKNFASKEDARFNNLEFTGEKNEDVERVRMAHLNDIENILPFFMVGYLYCFTEPGNLVATILFLVFTVSRYLHTIVYAVYVVPQPARGICYIVAMLINIYMAVRVVITFSQHITFNN